MLHAGELRSRDSLTGRCFWLGSWIPKPGVAFPVLSPYLRASVENLDPELTAGSRQGTQQRREVGSV